MEVQTELAEVGNIACCEPEVPFECRRRDQRIEWISRTTQGIGGRPQTTGALGDSSIDGDYAIAILLRELAKPCRQLGAPHRIGGTISAVGNLVQRDDG